MTRNVVSMDVREADHRFANHLALLSGFVRLKAADLARQPAEPTIAGVQLLLESVRGQIEAIAHLHRSLALGSWRGRADLKEHLHKVCAPFSSLVGGRIALIEDVSPSCQVSPDRILPVTQIVSEVVTNAVKHAYPPGQCGTIVVRGRIGETGAVIIEIVDDGPGLPDGFDVAGDRGLGFRLIGALAKQLGALVEFDSQRAGLSFRLTLPSEVESLRRSHLD
jgi:two-component sensor histidine kinase